MYSPMQSLYVKGSAGDPLPTVFPSLDNRGTKLLRGQLCLVCAGPGTGKSAFVLTYALKAAVPTLYFSADSDAFTQLSRMVSMNTSTPPRPNPYTRSRSDDRTLHRTTRTTTDRNRRRTMGRGRRMTALPWILAALFFTALFTIKRLEGVIMSETQDAVDAVVAQLGKARAEIVAEIANLEAQIGAGEAPDLTALKAAAQALDDVVPDSAPVEPAPVEDAPASE